MKNIILLTIMSVFSLSASVYSQNARFSVSMRNVSVKDVLVEIEKQSNFKFVYRNELVDVDRKVDVEVTNMKVEEILNKIFPAQSVNYKVFEDNIIVITSVTKEAQQGITITGTVADASGEKMPGVNVVIKETQTGVATDINGKFTIQVPDANAVLVFTSIGYDVQEVAVGNQKNITVTMSETTSELEEVVVIGYGVQKKATLTGSVTSVDSDDIKDIPSSNLANVLAGRMSGVYVTQSTGTPGIAASIRIRAQGSWTGNSNVPLFVIDGIVRDADAFNMLDANEIQEISILKDAASAAIYGARGGNGVVLVTTKKGAQGVRVNATASLTLEKPTMIPEMMDVVQNIEIDNGIFGPDRTEYFTPDEIEHFRKNGRYDWLKEAYETPVTQYYAVNVAGGKDSTKYFLGASYFDQGGFLPSLSYNRYNFRSNIETKVAKNLTAGMQLSYNQGERQRYNFTYDYSSNDLNNLWGKLLYYNFWVPPYIDGKPVDSGWISHPIERMRNGGYWRTSNRYMDGLVWLNYNIPWVKGLSAKMVYGLNKESYYSKSFDKKHTRYTFERTGGHNHIFTNKLVSSALSSDPGQESISYSDGEYNYYQLNFQLNYDRKIGNHHVNGVFVYEQSTENSSGLGAGRNNFPIIVKDQFWAASEESKDQWNAASEREEARVSYVGRLSYDYAEKYILNASVRRDGSMYYAPDQRWGWFPSVSAAWRISQEDFWNVGFINNLKFRGSYGMSGFDYTYGWQWQEKYIKYAGYIFDQSLYQGIAYGGIVNPNLTWEKSAAINFGIDVVAFEHITLVADYWANKRSDIMGSRILSIPDTYGGVLPEENYGKTESQGVDLELGYYGKTDIEINYFVKGTFAWATNKITLQDVAENVQDVDNPNGKPMGYYKGWVDKGILRTQADIDKLPAGYTIHGHTPVLGMLDFEDLSGPNGVPDGKIDDYDRTMIGKYSWAPYMLGLILGANWKGISAEVFFQGETGNQKMYSDGYGRRYPAGNLAFAHWSDHWSPETPDGKYPKPVDWDVTHDHNPSTFWLSDGSYVRLRYVNIGYSIPHKWISKVAGIQQLKISVSGTNLLYLSKFKFYDPEIASQMSYPNMKTLNMGLSLTF